MVRMHQHTCKVRVVCLSDTHNAVPGSFKLPKGDVLIHAGDLTNQGSLSELQKAVRWIEAADFQVKIVVAGNHDITLDSDFYAQHGSSFHNQNPQDSISCQKLLDESSSIVWLKHESRIIDLVSSSGQQVSFKIFGSPFSPAKGRWAFGYEIGEAYKMWNDVPPDTDIVVTHTPPKYICDAKEGEYMGCEALREALQKIRPQLAVCGHVHEGRGVEIIDWDAALSSLKMDQLPIYRWTDPGKDNKKTSLVDLTERPNITVRPKDEGSFHSSSQTSQSETCVVNCAIMASSWPHRGGIKYNKPIVVDIALPI
ncbi:metallophosphoesterase domain-containing protein [Xylogone sp. PMI_703]|nr:metallophosphoesterase domain-containing protein [Xylogone sp. PMI_703]